MSGREPVSKHNLMLKNTQVTSPTRLEKGVFQRA